MALNFLTLNTKGLNHPAKRRSLWKDALQNKCDILCVQETHFALHSHPKFPHLYMANAEVKKRGVMVAVRDSVAFHLHDIITDPQGRYLILVCTINSIIYTVVNVYAPNVRQTRFFHKIMKKVRAIQKGLLIVCGDFNITSDPSVDMTSYPKRIPPSLKASIQSHDMFDVWRCLNANERDFTFYSTAHGSYSRIDMFLVDKPLLFKCKKAKINSITWSDHASVALTVGDSSSHGPTYLWRANPSLLREGPSRSYIEKKLGEFFELNQG